VKTTVKKRCESKLITSEHLSLKQLREEVNLTLEEAGKNLGLTKNGIGAIENGRVCIDKKRIEEIVNSYGLDYLDFIRAKKIIEKEDKFKKKRKTIKRVLNNSDRRSYQKIITKECEVLKSMRRIKKISQDSASKLCNAPRSYIGHIENGRIELSKERIKQIVEAYGSLYSDFEANLNKSELRDKVIDNCIKKMEKLDDLKLDIVKNLLGSF